MTSPTIANREKDSGELSWLKRTHPLYSEWTTAEDRQRSTFLATLELLAKYLQPYRFEGKKKGEDLPRAHVGHVPRINAAYVSDLIGHIRSAPAVYNWGPLGDGGSDNATSATPNGEDAKLLWQDATGDGVPWKDFFEGKVLEWILTSLGGIIVGSIPAIRAESIADERERGKRPTYRFFPMSNVEDLGRGRIGFRWIKTAEKVDLREPRDDSDRNFDVHRTVYEFEPKLEEGHDEEEEPRVTGLDVVASRYDSEGDLLREANMGDLKDREGQPRLPVVHARFREHYIARWLGAGLLLGLDDIVIDIYNIWNETRENLRAVVFSVVKHKGPDAEKVQKALIEGSRFIALGTDSNADVEYLSAAATEIAAGLDMLKAAFDSWAASAKQNAAQAQAAQGPRSGMSLEVEFQIDAKPLLVEITERLDAIESDAMYLAAQLWDSTLDPASEDMLAIGVERKTDFRPEDEATRITRLVGDFQDNVGPLPVEALEAIGKQWFDSANLVDPSTPITNEEGEETTVGEEFRTLLRRSLNQRQEQATLQAERGFPSLEGF